MTLFVFVLRCDLFSLSADRFEVNAARSRRDTLVSLPERNLNATRICIIQQRAEAIQTGGI